MYKNFQQFLNDRFFFVCLHFSQCISQKSNNNVTPRNKRNPSGAGVSALQSFDLKKKRDKEIE